MYMKKNITEVKTDELSKRARAICNLHSCYSFALVLHKNAFVFSQLEAQVDYYTENTENVHYARPGWVKTFNVLHKTFTDLRETMGNKQEWEKRIKVFIRYIRKTMSW